MKHFWKKALWAALLTAAFTLQAGCSDQETSQADSSVATNEMTSTAAVETSTEESVAADGSYTYEVNDDGTISITGYTGEEKSLEVPATLDGYIVSEIANHAFEANWDITSVVLPEGLTVIGEGAFMDCSALTDITIPTTVSQISRAAFASCTSLTSIELSETVSVVQEEAFTGCTAMAQLIIWNPSLEYDRWGLIEGSEPLDTMILCPAGAAIETWAQENGFTVQEIS